MKRYYYNGKEVSSRKANWIIIRELLGFVVLGIMCYGLMNMYMFIGAIYGM